MASRFFVLATDQLSADQEKKLVEFVTNNLSWWHWLPNFWLFRDDQNLWTIESIRDRFALIAPMARCMVLQVDPIDWTGRVLPDAKGNKMEDWPNRLWSRPR